MKDYAENCASECSIKSYPVKHFELILANVNAQMKHIENVLEEIVELAKTMPNFEVIKSIPRITDNLASRILAELGDISRFNNANQVIAYAGIDPIIYQSGQVTGDHLHISKKGDK